MHTKGCAPHELGGLIMLRLNARRVRRLPTRKCRRQLRAACAGLVLIAGVVSLSACSEATSGYDYETATHHVPAKLEPIKGTDVQRVIFDAEAAERVGLKMAPIRQNGQGKIMPYAAPSTMRRAIRTPTQLLSR